MAASDNKRLLSALEATGKRRWKVSILIQLSPRVKRTHIAGMLSEGWRRRRSTMQSCGPDGSRNLAESSQNTRAIRSVMRTLSLIVSAAQISHFDDLKSTRQDQQLYLLERLGIDEEVDL